MKSLYEQLNAYGKSDYYPFHMPGHKRRAVPLFLENPYELDITEIDGFDNLHHAEGILKEAMERAARVCQSEETHFLVNGSTCGLLTGIAACTNHGDKILVARNCHKAVYHSIFINELQPIYIYPPIHPKFELNCGISPEKIKEMLITYTEIKLVVLTSPTYEGVVSDIKEIARVVHAFGIPLMVDEAHGAHFGFHTFFPKSAITLGADIVIQSVHKTLPAFTQTALLHVNGELVNKEKIRTYLSIYQTSSPSYLLMAGIDWCMELLEKQGSSLFQKYVQHLQYFYEKSKAFSYIELFAPTVGKEIYAFDSSKLVIGIQKGRMTGAELYHILRKKYKLQMEMAAQTYVVAMTSVFDTKEGFKRLFAALEEIDQELSLRENENSETKKSRAGIIESEIKYEFPSCRQQYSIYEVFQKASETVSFEQSNGRISKEYLYLYPPGIPILAPGEVITLELQRKIKQYQRSGLSIQGLKDKTIETIEVVKA